MDTSIVTRVASSEDRERIESLLAAFRAEYSYTGTPLPLPALGGESLYVLLAEQGEELVAMMVVERCHLLAEGEEFLMLTDIYVLPAHRRGGIAAALMAQAKALAKQLQISALRLFVQDINLAALTTAARSGFTRHDEILLSYVEH